MHSALLKLDPNENVVYEITRHPIGAAPICLIGAVIFGFILILSFAISSFEPSFSQFVPQAIVYWAIVGLGMLDILITAISVHIYFNNKLIITSDNLVQILQTSLLSHKVSQLSLAKIQDVTANQHGFFQTVFKYASIDIETAGEEANFTFDYAKDPYTNSKRIIEAAENYLKQHELVNKSVLTE